MGNLGILERTFTIRLQRDLNHAPERVWKALTDDQEISAWMGYPSSLQPVVGAPIHIDFSPEEPLDGIVIRVQEQSLLAYTWGDSVLTWTLKDFDRGVRLNFCHHHVAPQFATGLAAGWHCFIDNLEAHLAGEAFTDRFEDLSEHYARQLDE